MAIASLGAFAVVGCSFYRSPLMIPGSTPSVDVAPDEATVVFVRPAPAVWVGAAKGDCTTSFEHDQDAATMGVRITDDRGRWLADVDPRTWVALSIPAGRHYLGAAPLTAAGEPVPDRDDDDALRAELESGRVYFVRVRGYTEVHGGCVDPDGDGDTISPVSLSPRVRLRAVKVGTSAWMSLQDWIGETTRREPDQRRQPPAPDAGFVGAGWSRVTALRGDALAAHTMAPEDGVGPDEAWAIFLSDPGASAKRKASRDPMTSQGLDRPLEQGPVLVDLGFGVGTHPSSGGAGAPGYSWRLDGDFNVLRGGVLRIASRLSAAGFGPERSATSPGILDATVGPAVFLHLGRGWWLAPEATAGVGVLSYSPTDTSPARFVVSGEASFVYASGHFVMRLVPASLDAVTGRGGAVSLQAQLAMGFVF